MFANRFLILTAFHALLLAPLASLDAVNKPTRGVPVSYELPADGPLPQTYLVTLAIVETQNPDWIVSQFVCGAARTVTSENGGKFTEIWDGLDDNFMPVPPGDYGVKGSYTPARQWPVDGQWHAITPKFSGGASPWLPSPDDWRKPEPFGGDPVGAPLQDVAVGPGGVAVFYYQYLENGLNLPMFDLNKPVGYDQFLRAFNSGGAGGGTCVATDGDSVWAFSTDGGPKYVYRADGQSFGVSHGANRSNGYLPAGWVTAMAAWRDAQAERTFVYVAQRGKIEQSAGDQGHRTYRESATDFVNRLTVHDGASGKIVAELPLAHALGLAVSSDVLYALQAAGSGTTVSSAAIVQGVPGAWQRVFVVPTSIEPTDLEVDSRGRFYLSDSAANKVFQLDTQGNVTRTFGRLPAQQPGGYDPQTLMAPEKLATWRDAQGEDRLVVVEQAGPNRVSEWSADGRLLREFMSLQTHANDGYGFDPEHPEHVYLPGKRGWMNRFKVNDATHQWTVDAVWPLEENDPRAGRLDRLQFIRTQGRAYLAGRRSFTIYRFEGERLLLSAGILRLRKDPQQRPAYAFWHDANGNGRVDEEELAPTEPPGAILTYHGQNWLEDLSLLAPAQGGQDVWRLAPSGFDAHGNPVFTTWTKVLTDPIFAARSAGTADALHGGNELAESFTSDWMGADGSPETGYYVQARGGKNFSANEGPQHKITRYVPDGRGGYVMKWRTGRSALQWLARPGEMYGALRIQRPINGLLSVVDQSRCGVLLYTDDGLYVDTLFPDGRRFNAKTAGIYPQPGEFFAGQVVPNRDNGRIYLAMGKYTPLLYEVEGWSLHENPVHRIEKVQGSVSIAAAQIASPPEIALSLRGGAGAAKFARFSPGLGEPAFDGSLAGWESCEPVMFQAENDQSVEVRCLYQPDRLLLRWHARLGKPFTAKPLPPLERVFTHDQLADTLSFYIQSDTAAKPGVGDPAGRPGDARFVFGVFQDDSGAPKPVAVGLYADWRGRGKPSPQVYRTPVGEAKFAHVGAVEGAQLTHRVDADGQGFVLVAAIPRAALPRLTEPFAGGFRTLVNFEATLGGHNKLWWANSDGSASRETYDEPTEARLYPGSWAPVEFTGLDRGIVVRHWLLAGPFGGPGAERFQADPNGVIAGTTIEMKKAVREFCEAARYPLDDAQVDLKTVFTGDLIRGYWPDPARVSWKSVSIEPLDTRVICGSGGQVWYGATWIQTPGAVELDAEFHSHPMTELRWTLNGEPIPLTAAAYQGEDEGLVRIATQRIALRGGWNELRFRGYCFGYPPFRVGLVLKAAEEKLWPLKLSATPPAQQAVVVDEPLGARYSLGMTLWHLGHNAELIGRFHESVKAQGMTPENLLPTTSLTPPGTMTRILVEPERLDTARLNGWQVDKEAITSGAGDSGPTVSIPVRIPQAGCYRLWVLHYANLNARGVTSLKIYRTGQEPLGPICQPDEIYDTPAVDQAGYVWKDLVVDLPAGDLTVKLGHVTRWWHGSGGYDLRRVDCLYLTQELWAGPPAAEARTAIRDTGAPDGIQWTSDAPLTDVQSWQWWQLRPISWEAATANPKLFTLSRQFWQSLISQLEPKEYDETAKPDYREPERQVVYNETWNMVANPVRARRQINVLTADISRQPLKYHYVWHDVGSHIPGLHAEGNYEKGGPSAKYGGWYGGPGRLEASYGSATGEVTTFVPVTAPGKYSVWVLSNPTNLGYTAPWYGKVSAGGREQFIYHHQGKIPNVWMKMGDVTVEQPGQVQVDFILDDAGAGGTYRRIYTLFLVDDPSITPNGTVRPPWTMEMFRERAAQAGASPTDKLLVWIADDPYRPLSQEVWADEVTSGDGWPYEPVKGTDHTKTLLMAGDANRAVQVGLRNLSDAPVTLDVQVGPLTGTAGTFPQAVTWRAEAFVPYGADRQAWTPFFLMRRAKITAPPLNVAGVWLTVDTHGVPPGQYESLVHFRAEGLPAQTVSLQVRVCAVKPNPKQPVLVDGWTQPHEGEAYLRDFVEHGMNVWPGEMSKADMQKWGIRQLRLSYSSTEGIPTWLARLRALGLDYDDYFVGILDEPGGTTPEALKPFLDVAQAIRAADPKVRIGFNPSEAAQLATFQILAPYCDFWCPYSLHVFSPYYGNPEKKKIYQPQPWMWYTTPCLWDKTAREPGIRSAPSQSGNCVGVAFFALNYPWRDQWDTAYEHLNDASTMGTVLSRHGPVATIAWEQIREARQTADLAMLVRERMGVKTFDEVTDPDLQRLIREGSSEDIIRWLVQPGD